MQVAARGAEPLSCWYFKQRLHLLDARLDLSFILLPFPRFATVEMASSAAAAPTLVSPIIEVAGAAAATEADAGSRGGCGKTGGKSRRDEGEEKDVLDDDDDDDATVEEDDDAEDDNKGEDEGTNMVISPPLLWLRALRSSCPFFADLTASLMRSMRSTFW